MRTARLFSIVLLVLALLLVMYFGRFSFYFLGNDSGLVRKSAFYFISEIYGWDKQAYHGGDLVGLMLDQYTVEKQRGNFDTADSYMRGACSYVHAVSGYDPSISFINAIADNELAVVSFWLYRRIDISTISVYSEVNRKNLEVSDLIIKIREKDGYAEMSDVLGNYVSNHSIESYISDPCARNVSAP